MEPKQTNTTQSNKNTDTVTENGSSYPHFRTNPPETAKQNTPTTHANANANARARRRGEERQEGETAAEEEGRSQESKGGLEGRRKEGRKDEKGKGEGKVD